MKMKTQNKNRICFRREQMDFEIFDCRFFQNTLREGFLPKGKALGNSMVPEGF